MCLHDACRCKFLQKSMQVQESVPQSMRRQWGQMVPISCHYRFHNITQSTALRFSSKHDTQLSLSYGIIQTNAAKAMTQYYYRSANKSKPGSRT